MDGHLSLSSPLSRYDIERRRHILNMVYEGENPPAGAIIDFWSAEDRETAEIIVFSEEGAR